VVIPPFSIARLPRIVFGPGSLGQLPGLLQPYGRRVLVVTGARSFVESPHWNPLRDELQRLGMRLEHLTVAGEPSPQVVDVAATELRGAEIDVVVGIGGGSVLDAAKAMAGLLRVSHSVMDYLEGVGPERPYEGPAVPYVAVPTTAGTGSEATKNAVLSVRGPEGFKKSFRAEALVPQHALIDPDLLATCPGPQIAANGMDALTQLLESYVSVKANPFTDALAWSGLEAVRDGLFAWYEEGPRAGEGREKMAYASLLSGITLAQVGLGSVHGLASPLGAFHPIPHGVVCGTLVAAATEVNIRALEDRDAASTALLRYARVGRLLSGADLDDRSARAALVDLLSDWTRRLDLPPLAHFGVADVDLDRVVAHSRGSSMRTNPIVLTDAEIRSVLERRLG
jgi:alcohol dehydrogenase class IV